MKTNVDLQRDVYEELKWDPRINEADIGVSVNNGIVTMGGTIPSFAEKWAAEDAVKKVAGVTAVVNKIDVNIPGGATPSDQELAQAARSAIQWNVWVPEESIKLIVEKGWVNLSGEVEFEHQRREAETAVRHLAGVRGVINTIMVTPKIKSKDIHAQIKRALHRHAEDDAKQIHVEVNEGEVVLTGRVHSWDERSAAEWAALGTSGVRHVKNNVSVHYF